MKNLKNIIGALFITGFTLALLFPIQKGIICNECGEYNCIYLELDQLTKGKTDEEISVIIWDVSERRNYTQNQIDMLFNEYLGQ